jgi:hypothetical protein
MGFLKKATRAMGKLDTDLIERGLLARGKVVECRRTGVDDRRAGEVRRV